jgi:hypothetical protein
MPAQHQTKRKFSMQPLEDRHMFAGNVLAGLVGPDLTINGDAADNQFEITEITSNSVEVRGLSGTTINGLPSQVFTTSLIENIFIQTNAGNDEVIVKNVTLTDTAAGNLKIATSLGEDHVHLDRVFTTQSIELDTGDQNDRVEAVMAGTQGTWYTNSGRGHDSVQMHRVSALDMKVEMQDGNDELNIFGARIGNDLKVNTHNDNDMVGLDRIFAGNDVLIRTEQGSDQVKLHRIRANNDVGLETGSDPDFAHFEQVAARNNLFANMGTGDDELTMDTVKSMVHIGVSTEDGNDRVKIVRAKSTDVHVDAGDDHDYVEMDNVNAVTDLHVLLGSGKDTLAISNSSAANPIFDGGNDRDILYNLPNAFALLPASVNFEIII